SLAIAGGVAGLGRSRRSYFGGPDPGLGLSPAGLGGLGDFSRTNTARANCDVLHLASIEGAHLLQVGLILGVGLVVGVANAVSRLSGLFANQTHAGHSELLFRRDQ